MNELRRNALVGTGNDDDGVASLAAHVDEGHAGRGAIDGADIAGVNIGSCKALQLHLAKVVFSDAAEHGDRAGSTAQTPAGDSLVGAFAAA